MFINSENTISIFSREKCDLLHSYYLFQRISGQRLIQCSTIGGLWKSYSRPIPQKHAVLLKWNFLPALHSQVLEDVGKSLICSHSLERRIFFLPYYFQEEKENTFIILIFFSSGFFPRRLPVDNKEDKPLLSLTWWN